ncbi:LamG domain-containing protein [Pedobacter polaris]|uniref:LamG domain-containing protein n=1 Tax=Pedobacter polaris TaxID=2571273 RepID=A0A4V5P1T6_9SPHI|nr:LamG-like jellyroll fold domain-containing protein [Pedobacter polaris]TKC04751.1 LamG domain-containing protein [Pedobacter polaris]
MRFSNLYKYVMLGLLVGSVTLSSCKKDDNPNDLEEVDPADYVGTIDGFKSSDEIYPANLVAYFSFDENYAEKISGTAPTLAAGNTLVTGIKGKAVSLNAGYLYYGTQLANLKTDVFKSFTISQWIKISNNGSKRTMLLTLARPGNLQGSLNINLNTNSRPATNLDFIGIQPVFATVGGGTQDNLNNTVSPKIGPDNWVHLVLAYNGLTGRLNIVANGVNIGSFSDRGVGNNLFKSYEPGELIFGANYNLIPGKTVNTDAAFGAMTGVIDEVRIYNRFMPDAIIKSMYQLGLANK